MLIIKSQNFLTSSNLVYDKGAFKWCTDIPDNAIISDEGVRSLEEIAAVFGKNIEPLIPSNYLNSANKLSVNPPWSLYIGNQKFKMMIQDYVNQYDELIKTKDQAMLNAHAKISCFIDSLQPAEYCLSLLKEEHKHITSHIEPYLTSGILDKPIYTRNKTKTGRLSVIKGPNVLTMHSSLRSGIKNGYCCDFVSIEPNVLLVSQGREPRIDIYEHMRKELFTKETSRAKVKIATMAALYGTGRKDKFATKVSDFFDLDNVIKKLEAEVRDDKIENMYGRVINLDGAKDNHLLALWLQSSAADAALLGFYNFSKLVSIVPHWIIHDGLIFIYKQNAKKINTLDVGLQYELPIKVEKL